MQEICNTEELSLTLCSSAIEIISWDQKQRFQVPGTYMWKLKQTLLRRLLESNGKVGSIGNQRALENRASLIY
jgi:hypothetical protein